MTVEACYTIVCAEDSFESIPITELKTLLEKGSEDVKIDTMKKVLNLMANGHSCEQLLMTCIRFVMPTQKNKLLKKLLLAFFEGCEKTNADGKLKQEMILVCNALRNDLQHPNEFVRGSTLRFLCKLKEAELLEPLVPSIKSCLEHRHSYVRKNAVFAVVNVYKHFDYLIPDAADLLLKMLLRENEPNCRKNCFLALISIDMTKAIEFFYLVCDRLEEFDINFHICIMEMIRKDLNLGFGDHSKYLKVLSQLLSSNSGMVKYEAAYTILAISNSSSVIREIAKCFIDLAVKESDNNVKLIALNRLKELKGKYSTNLDDMVMSLLPVLSSSDYDVNKQCLDIILDILTVRYSDEFIHFIKKELIRLNNDFDSSDKNQEYKKILLNALDTCLKRFPDCVSTIMDSFLSLIDDSNVPSASDSLVYIRQALLKFPATHSRVIISLLTKLPSIKSIKLVRGILWIIGNFSFQLDEIKLSFEKIMEAIGPLPFQLEVAQTEENADVTPQMVTRTRVLADGTYATETALGTVASKETKHSIKDFLLEGNFFIGALLSACLVKLLGHLQQCNAEMKLVNELKAKSLLIMCNIIKLGQSKLPQNKIDSDSYLSILTSIRVIGFADKSITKSFLDKSLSEFDKVVEPKPEDLNWNLLTEKALVSQFDQQLSFRFIQDTSRNLKDEFSVDFAKAVASDYSEMQAKSRLDSIVQLTGFSDPVYVEAFVETEKFDVNIDMLLVNQTSETLRNLTIELYATNGLKAVTKPGQYNVGPHGFQILKASFKSTESGEGVIYGVVTYDGTSAADTFVVNMKEVKIDVLQQLKSSDITDSQFRTKWVILEWENKINIDTNHKDIRAFLKLLMATLKMRCVNVEPQLEGPEQINYMVANLACATASGQDVLMNVCIRKDGDKINGHCRIRSQLQGIVYSLGEKVTACQQTD